MYLNIFYKKYKMTKYMKGVKMSSKVKTKKTFKTQEPLVNRGVPVSGELQRTVSGF